MNPALDSTFAALADPTRRSILDRLADGPRSVRDLAEPSDLSQQAISKHLAVLRRAGLITQRRSREDGRQTRCALVAEPLDAVTRWIERCRSA